MSSQNREEKSFGDWLYYTKKKGNKTITPCSAIIMENKQELDNWKKELYESYSQEKHRYIKKIREVVMAHKRATTKESIDGS